MQEFSSFYGTACPIERILQHIRTESECLTYKTRQKSIHSSFMSARLDCEGRLDNVNKTQHLLEHVLTSRSCSWRWILLWSIYFCECLGLACVPPVSHCVSPAALFSSFCPDITARALMDTPARTYTRYAPFSLFACWTSQTAWFTLNVSPFIPAGASFDRKRERIFGDVGAKWENSPKQKWGSTETHFTRVRLHTLSTQFMARYWKLSFWPTDIQTASCSAKWNTAPCSAWFWEINPPNANVLSLFSS